MRREEPQLIALPISRIRECEEEGKCSKESIHLDLERKEGGNDRR